ncbi:uncharacterized protein [Hyperolius riggenbachi]|uniref:uncharacterized protein n=1 Tax=Hyperolius riggenbachi TaxID=752182 RepID=UPI0035A3B18E
MAYLYEEEIAIFHPLTGTPVTTFSTNSQSPLATGSADTPTILGEDLLYPYGPAIDGTTPKSDDGSTPAIPLSIDLPIFGHNHSYVYVNNNGLLSFHFRTGQFIAQPLPVAYGNPFLALFWADINNQVAGDIYYRQSTDPDLLSRATSDIRSHFHNKDFTAQWVFVATWDRVAYYGSSGNKTRPDIAYSSLSCCWVRAVKILCIALLCISMPAGCLLHPRQVNTFQGVVCTDGNHTYVLLNYKDIQWPSLGGNDLIHVGSLALAGINSGYNTGYYTIPGSLSLDIVNISSTSNVNVPGRWVFRVDRLHPEDVSGILDNATDVPVEATDIPIPIVELSIFSQQHQPIFETDLLYPYGPGIDIVNIKSDDGGSPVISLSAAIPLFGSRRSYLYVNNNGLLSFHFQIGQYTPQALPVAFGNPFVALFWANINNQLAGDVYYRESTDPDLLSRATSDVMTYFRDVNFTAQWAFVATWNRVAYYGSTTDKVNTFQAILCSDGNLTFVLLNYDDLQWSSVNASSNLTDGPLALAGLNSGYSTGYYTLPGSMTLDIVNLSSTSNVNVTGRWVFKVDGLHPEDVNGFLGMWEAVFSYGI